MSRGFRAVHVFCLWIGNFKGTYKFGLNSMERIHLWELQKERDFKSIMGAKGRAKFLESNLSF